MGMNILSLFDGMSCGRLALNKAGLEVDNYVASEVKPFAINHTKAKFPDTIDAGDVTKLHYEGGKLYRDCKRWCIGDPSVLSRDDLEKNKDHIKTATIGGQDFVLVNVVDLEFGKGFDEKNKILADYKDNGLVLNASTLSEDELNVYRNLGFVDLPNGEIAIWEFDESNKIFEGTFDILIGGSPCFTAETPVLTKDGYKPIVDVKVGNEVVSHDGKLHKVTAFMEQGEKPIFEVNTSFGGKLRTTINHEFYVRRKCRKGHNGVRTFEEPKMVAVGDFAPNCKDYYIGFPINQNEIVPEWNGVDTHINQTKSTRVICNLDMNDEGLWYLVGRYLGDGCLRTRKGKCRTQYAGVTIVCGNDKVEDFKSKISNTYNYSVKPHSKGTHRFCFDSVELAAFMSQFGKLASGKFLPGFVYDMPVNLIKPLIQGYVDSDGSYIKNQNEWKLTSINKNLLLGFGTLIAKAYHRPYSLTEVKVAPKTVIEGRTVNQHDWYTIKWHYDERKQDHMFYENGYIWGPIRSVQEDGVEEVYDITVDETHTFVASNVMVSNCQNFSLASSTNDEKYGLEGPKSRLFFDYIRLRSETSPRYYFLENVNMKNDSKEMLDGFLGNEGVLINSEAFTIQHRPRVYWTNIPTDGKIVSDKTEDEINFQNFKLRTLPRLEWALYVKKFPGSYFGYDDNAIETIKGGFVFDDELTDDTNRLVNRRTKVVEAIEGTKRDIREIVNFDENNNPDVSFTDEEAFEIARMNEWARSEVEAFVGEPISDRKFVDFVHNQMLEAMVKKSPSRDGMRYGKHQTDADGKDKFVGQCHNITNAPRIQCLTRKQDRFPNSGLITFGPYCRFVTKLEICKGQTVPYEFLGDLKYGEVQDVCGDGWTVDVVAKFFEKLATNEDTLVENNAELHIEETKEEHKVPFEQSEKEHKVPSERSEEEHCKIKKEAFEETTIEKESESMMLNDANIGEDTVKDASETSPLETAAPKQNNDEKEGKLASIPKGKVDSALVFESIRKHCDEKTYSKILYDVVGWKAIKKMSKDDVDEEIVEIIREEIREAIKGRALSSSKEIEEKFEWLI